MNKLFYGDNLEVLREHMPDDSVDLVYLDPPFNSNTRYNVLFASANGTGSDAQVEAFMDTWRWGEQAANAYDQIMSAGLPIAEVIRSCRVFLRESDMMAYLCMMTVRLVELHRVLKRTGSLYLHCDPTASHYLKIILDGVFGADAFRNEIVWQRTTPKGLAFTRFSSNHDIIFFYTKSTDTVWNTQFIPHREEYIQSHYGHVEPATGRRYQLTSLLNPSNNRPNLTYEFPPRSGTVRVWRWKKDRMLEAWKAGRIVVPKRGGVARYKRYLDEMQGSPVGSVWTDIPPVNSQAKERLGYPTQKPLALMDRIIRASSNLGDRVLDPFCGCGTTIHAAQELGREWIGIDVTHYAVSLIEARLRSSFPELDVRVEGRPVDYEAARDLARRDKFQFQWWANWRIGVQNYREHKKGSDRGIDGTIFFRNGPYGTGRVLISVKGGEKVGVASVRDLRGTLEREGAELGVLISVNPPTRDMVREAAAAGVQHTAHGNIPKIQIVNAKDLVEDRLPRLPPAYQAPTGRSRTKEDRQLSLMLGIPGGKTGEGVKKAKKGDPVVVPAERVLYPSAAADTA